MKTFYHELLNNKQNCYESKSDYSASRSVDVSLHQMVISLV